MTRLYDLPEEIAPLADTEDDAFEDRLADLLAAYNRSFVEGDLLTLGKVVKTLESEQQQLATHALDTDARMASVSKRIERLKSYMLNLATTSGVEKAKDALVSVWTQKNPASVEVDDEAAVPLHYKRATVNLSYALALELLPDDILSTAQVAVLRQKIIADVKDTGEVVPGVTVVNDRKHLRVK